MSPNSDRERSSSSTSTSAATSTSTRRPWRRRAVLATAAATLGALAGCNESGGDDTTGATTTAPRPTTSDPGAPATTGRPTTVGSTTAAATERTAAPELPPLPDGEWELPSYVDRSAFREVDLTIAREGCDLPARLSVPVGESPFPAAVIVHGSGPQDMDGTIGPVRPYRDLAWGLASRGVGVLRYDKVTAVCPRALSPVTLDTVVVDDAVRAVERLREWAGRPGHPALGDVSVIGHSLGGGALPRIVDRADVAGGVALAGNARPLYVALVDQIRTIQRADGTLTDAENETYARLQTGLDRIEAGEYEAAAEVFRAYGLTAEFVRSLDEYDRFATARGTSVPLTFAQGSADARVTVADDFERWRSELADRPETRFELYDGLNHLFTPAPGGFGRTAYATPSNVARSVIEDLAAWLGGEGAV